MQHLEFFLVLSPILLTVVLMVFFNKPAKIVLPLAFLTAVVLASLFWNAGLEDIAKWSLFGILKAVDILIIIFGALWNSPLRLRT